MVLLVTSHILAAALLLGLGARLGRRATIAAALVVPGVAFAWFASRIGGVADGAERSQRWTWLPDLDVALSFRLDGFALLMALVVTGMGALVLAYSGSYFGPDVPLERLSRFAGGFVAFAGAMLGLVLADDVWTLFIFWEATTITSFVLIGLDHERAGARSAAQQALLVTGAGGLALFGGLALLADAAGTTALAGLDAAPTTAIVVQVGLVLVLVGAFTKSAQFPFQFWLPGAMAAPTPVSAFLHSATMVKAGVVLVGRLAPLFAEVSWWRPTLVVVGGLTMLTGGLNALRQHDAKLLLAHGTVSQLGLLMILFGLGYPETTMAGVAVLLGHALFKAALFLSVGVVDHATGTRDIRRLTGVGRELPWVAGMTAVAAASMVGLPPLFGFVAKEAALDALVEEGDTWSVVGLVVIVIGSILTTAYSARLWFGVFGDPPQPADEPATVHHRPSFGLTGPVAILVVLTVVGGLVAGPLGDRLLIATQALDPAADGYLTLWAGLHLPIFLSVFIVAAGIGLHLLLARTPGLPAARISGTRAFQTSFDGLLDGARRVTAVVQSGSLPAYMAIVFIVLITALAGAFVGGASIGPAGATNGGSVLQGVVALLAAGMAVAIVAARRRFVAVLMLGAVGYAMAAIFMLYGAPDLALTQVLIETITLVVFLLVLRHLPEGYSSPPEWAPRAVRIAISLAVGLGVAGFALAAGTARTTSPVADEIVARSEPDAAGRNVVNVILVDVRGADTLGELTVLAIAAAGVANLVRAARRDQGEGTDPLGEPGPARAAGAGPGSDPPDTVGPRSVIFDQVSRAVFTLTLLVSVYITLRGHNAPGGGFAGGLIAGIAFVMRYLAGGSPRLRRPRALPTSGLVGTGLLLAVGTGLVASVYGDQFLASSVAEISLPLIGEAKLVSSTVFDIGVYVLVLGVVLSVLTHLGSESGVEPPASADRRAAPSSPR